MVQAIIFDFGGVLGTDADTIFIDVLKKNKINKEKALEIWRKHWPKLKIGEEHVDAIWITVSKHTDVNIENIKKEYYNAVIVDRDMLELCRKLKDNGYKMGMLANETLEWMDIKREKGCLNEIFDVVYSSADLKTPKPYKEAYEKTIASLGVEPNNTLFIDNMERNTKAAEDVGTKSLYFTDIETLKKDLQSLRIIY